VWVDGDYPPPPITRLEGLAMCGGASSIPTPPQQREGGGRSGGPAPPLIFGQAQTPGRPGFSPPIKGSRDEAAASGQGRGWSG